MTERVPSAPDFPPGTMIGGRYRVDRLLGQGGMGAVYSARHVGTGRGVALKFLLADERDLRLRMQREALALGSLAHPNVVGVLDVAEHDGSVFLVMELLDGKNLRDYVGERRFSPSEAVALLMPAFQGVEAAHRAGILHRDLKPDNLFVLVDDDGVAFDTKVLDFGIARPLGVDGSGVEITRSGAVVGTPKYISPEQIRGSRELGPGVDVFALGLILYELVVGQSPYDATSYESLIIEIATQPPASPKTLVPELPDDFVAVVLRSLEKRPADRFESVVEFARALEPFAPGVRFVVPRRAQAASLVDSEGAFAPRRDPTAAETQAWSELAEDRVAATKQDRPRHLVSSLELAETVAPQRSAGATSEPGHDIPTRDARRPIVLALALAAVGAGALALAAMRADSDGADADVAIETATTIAPVERAPAALPPPPMLAGSPDGTTVAPATVSLPVVAAAEPSPRSDATSSRGARGRPDAEPGARSSPPSSTAVAAPVAAVPAPTPVPMVEATSEAHGRAGTIRSDDF